MTINNYKTLSKEELVIYSKQIVLEQIGLEGQNKLKKSKVLVVGAGGLGCPVMIYLTMSGIGKIGIIDDDYIELSNLNRQILYNKTDIKKKKVSCARKKLENINRYCNVIEHKYKLNAFNSIEIISRYDLIIDTTDNFSTRYIIDEACHKTHKTYIYGAINNFEGQVGVFNYKDGIRYKDLYKKEQRLINKSCNEEGVMGINTSYIGNLQAIEAIKVILGLNKRCKNFVLLSKMIQVNLIKKKIYPYKEQTKKTHNLENQKITNIRIEKVQNNSIVLDLRENKDFNKQHIQKSINIPMAKFKLNKTIKFLKNYAEGSKVQIYCNTINRSKTTSRILKHYNIEHEIISQNKESTQKGLFKQTQKSDKI